LVASRLQPKQYGLAPINTSYRRRYSTSSTVKSDIINNNKKECATNTTDFSSSATHTGDNLNPWFITGITDAEGSFSCIIKRNMASRFSLLSTSYSVLCSRPVGLYRGLGITVRNYSTVNTSGGTIQPVKIYNNMGLYRLNVVKENKGKSGIYRITNLTNNKTYIGSSVNLSHRFSCYYSIKHIERLKTSNICKALIKYGYSGFKLEILEYCSIKVLLEREQYYFNTLNPEYNILKTAGSNFGYKHTEETLMKFRKRSHTEEVKAQISLSQRGRKHSEETLAKLKGRIRSERSGRAKVQLEVYDLDTGIKTIYTTMKGAAQALGIYTGTISTYFSRSTSAPYKGRYIFKKIVSDT